MNKHFEQSHSGAVKLSPKLYFVSTKCQKFWSQWLRILRHGSTATCLLRLWVWILSSAWMSVFCECCALSDKWLCNGPLTRPEEFYRVWCV